MGKSSKNRLSLTWDPRQAKSIARVNARQLAGAPVGATYYGKNSGFYWGYVKLAPDTWLRESMQDSVTDLQAKLAKVAQGGRIHPWTDAEMLDMLKDLDRPNAGTFRFNQAQVDKTEGPGKPKEVPFEVPAVHGQLWKAGLLAGRGPHALMLSDVRFLTPQQIRAHRRPKHRVPGLVPFARNGMGDQYCWYAPWTAKAQTAVVLSPHDLNVATGYAPDLEGALYRMVLEDMAETLRVRGKQTPEQVQESFRRYADELGAFLPARWAKRLGELARRPLKQIDEMVWGSVSGKELDRIIRGDLKFAHLDEEFDQESPG